MMVAWRLVLFIAAIGNGIDAFTHGPTALGVSIPDGLSGMFAIACLHGALHWGEE
jgi:hypothetical protein